MSIERAFPGATDKVDIVVAMSIVVNRLCLSECRLLWNLWCHGPHSGDVVVCPSRAKYFGSPVKRSGEEKIIGVEESNDWLGGLSQTCVAGCRQSTVGPMAYESKPRISALPHGCDVRGPIGRCIINHITHESVITLGGDRLKTSVKEILSLVSRHDDGDGQVSLLPFYW
jgi:hypothetical protein